MFQCMVIDWKISIRWLTSEKHKRPKFAGAVEILSTSKNEEEANKYILKIISKNVSKPR